MLRTILHKLFLISMLQVLFLKIEPPVSKFLAKLRVKLRITFGLLPHAISGCGSNRLADIQELWTAQFSTPAHAAATVTEKFAIFKAPFDCTVTSVGFGVGVAVSGADTNTTHINLDDGGADRTGTTEVGNYDCTSGNDLTANTEQELAGVAGAGTDFNLDEGDYLLLEFEKVGNGLAIGAATGIISYKAR